MEAKDTVMSITNNCSIIFSPEELRDERIKQAEISFEAGKREAAREVIGEIEALPIAEDWHIKNLVQALKDEWLKIG